MPLPTHGMSKTPTYRCWSYMLSRCRNPNDTGYADYGGRGISVCDRWRYFENFYEDMGGRPDNHSLDRIDNNGPYSPDNCRWAIIEVQANNKRSSLFLTWNGQTKTAAQWARKLDIPRTTIVRRVRAGKTVEEILSKEFLESDIETAQLAARAKARAQTHCKHGHPLIGENLYIRPNGNRSCVECCRTRSLNYYYRERAAFQEQMGASSNAV